jgi:hypothetical protein
VFIPYSTIIIIVCIFSEQFSGMGNFAMAIWNSQKHNIICVRHAIRKQTKWNKYNMALPQATGGKDKPNNVCIPLFFMCLFQGRKYIIVLGTLTFWTIKSMRTNTDVISININTSTVILAEWKCYYSFMGRINLLIFGKTTCGQQEFQCTCPATPLYIKSACPFTYCSTCFT